MSNEIPLSDYLAIANTAFKWAQSCDYKQWDGLREIFAPSVRLDFRSLGGTLRENVTPDEVVAFISSTKLLGHPRLKTQHFIGASHWERLSDDGVHVRHQIRAAHQLYADTGFAVVANKGHAHGVTELWYKKIEGTWKIDGYAPDLNWAEYDLFGVMNAIEEAEGSEDT